jgi:NADPH:quinone reductase-like Zn-dependent oxidoreductase
MASNTAAWQNKIGDKFDVRDAPYTSPDASEIVIKANAWAINPADSVVQSISIFDWLEFPSILGFDLAGEVVEVGSAVTRLKKGDRVLAMAIGVAINKPSRAAFQEYVVVESVLAALIPDTMSYGKASIFPTCLSTAACGLFQDDFLALQYPSITPQPTGKTILIWGGASAVGCNAIQLAVAAGYGVITTASTHNFEYMKKLGASSVFDYKSSTVVDDVVSAINATKFAGIFMAAGSIEVCLEIADKANGANFVASALGVPENKPSGVEAKMVFVTSLKDDSVGPAIFIDFLPKALAQGSYVVAPEPLIVGKGLESLQDGIDAWKNGVSAKKIVITR